MRIFVMLKRRLKQVLWNVLLVLVLINVLLRIKENNAKATEIHLQKSLPSTEKYEAPKKDARTNWIPFFSTDSFSNNKMSSAQYEIKQWIKSRPDCADYFQAGLIQRMVHPYYYGRCDMNNIKLDKVLITLAIQMDMSDLYWEKLKQTVKHWSGPISIGLYIVEDKTIEQKVSLKENLERTFMKFGLMDSEICIHLLIEPISANSTSHQYFFPVNSLRNVATKYINTKYMLYVEADFIPMPRLAEFVQREIQNVLGNTTYKAFVIPAYYSKSRINRYPQNKKELVEKWNENIILPWWYNKRWKHGHLATVYEKIPNTTHIYQVEYKEYYEPYYVIEKHKSPYYPEEIMFGRKDKLVQTKLMDRLGYTFHVIPGAYIVHTPHTSTNHTKLPERTFRCSDIAFHKINQKIKHLKPAYMQKQLSTNLNNRKIPKPIEALKDTENGQMLVLYKPKRRRKPEMIYDPAVLKKIMDREMPLHWWAVDQNALQRQNTKVQ